MKVRIQIPEKKWNQHVKFISQKQTQNYSNQSPRRKDKTSKLTIYPYIIEELLCLQLNFSLVEGDGALIYVDAEKVCSTLINLPNSFWTGLYEFHLNIVLRYTAEMIYGALSDIMIQRLCSDVFYVQLKQQC